MSRSLVRASSTARDVPARLTATGTVGPGKTTAPRMGRTGILMCSDMASRGVGDAEFLNAERGSRGGTGQALFLARTLATLGTSEAGRRGGFSASSPRLRWSQRVSALALVKSGPAAA